MDKTRPRHLKTDGSQSQLYALFIERVRDYMHIVLAMSPIGDLFRNSVRSFPALVNCCTINWFQSWPADALQVGVVAAVYLCLCVYVCGSVCGSDFGRPVGAWGHGGTQ